MLHFSTQVGKYALESEMQHGTDEIKGKITMSFFMSYAFFRRKFQR